MSRRIDQYLADHSADTRRRCGRDGQGLKWAVKITGTPMTANTPATAESNDRVSGDIHACGKNLAEPPQRSAPQPEFGTGCRGRDVGVHLHRLDGRTGVLRHANGLDQSTR